MSNQERIAEFIRQFPGRDDDEIAAVLRIQPRQTVNQVCRALVKAGKIERRPGSSGKLANFPRVVGTSRDREDVQALPPVPAPAPVSDVTAEWFWEGNVTAALADSLEQYGWTILSQADTRSRERGLDLHATRKGRDLVVEVKGYPSRNYRNPARAGERKPTEPALQAHQWYSHALLKAVRLQNSHPASLVMMAFPDFPRYRTLYGETRSALERLGIAIAFVNEGGKTELIGV